MYQKPVGGDWLEVGSMLPGRVTGGKLPPGAVGMGGEEKVDGTVAVLIVGWTIVGR